MRDDTKDMQGLHGKVRNAHGKLALSATILRIGLPIMLSNIIEIVYNLTDTFFLGRLGTAEVSAPSITFSMVFFLTIFGVGLSGAGTTLIAQSAGKGDEPKMRHYLNQMMSLLLVTSLALAVVGSLMAGPLLRLLNTPAEVFSFAHDYLRIIFLGMPFTFIFFVLQASHTATGNTATPVRVHLLAILLNMALDPLLIFGLGPFPALGVAGAAIATIFSQGVGAVLSLIVLIGKTKRLHLDWQEMKPVAVSWKLLLKIGLPASIGQALSAFGFTVLQGVVNTFGTAVIVAFGVGNRLMNMFNIPSHGIANATTSLVGRALGARDEQLAGRVVKVALILVVALELPLLGLSVLYGGDLVRIFVSDPEAIRLGDIMFKVVSPSLLLFALFFALSGAFQGAGDTKIILGMAIFRLWVVRVPLAYLLAYTTSLGPLSIWIAMFASNFLTAVIGFAYFLSGRWKRALDPSTI
ncbi:MAG: MATE family efflux transporter [Spirochaetales bacterium]|nr:MATE family efflux transporter [Spirochaetales bacterium]